MLLKREVEVLVAGAGPVGLFAALLLARRGVKVAIVDEQHRTAARTYACALHPGTLELLDQAGLASPLLEKGERVDAVAFYEGEQRRAEVRYGELKGRFPFLLVLPQQTVEDALEEQLKREGVPVLWSHRLAQLRVEPTSATARIERLVRVGSGYSIQTSEWEVDREEEVRLPFVVGADGHRSRVRRGLGVELAPVGEPQLFAVFELSAEASEELPREVRVGVSGGLANVVWPLGQGWWRFGFQIDREPEEARREKSRVPALAGDPASVDLPPARFEALCRERTPWFTAKAGELAWSTALRFERRLAASFGRGAAWLLGDAAHLGPPVAVYSMNAGLREAWTLAGELDAVLRQGAPRERLDAWAGERRAEAQAVLARPPTARPGAAGGFASEHARLLGDCLPASGEQRAALLSQLGLAPG